jgi:hypothetical protein
MVGKQFGSDLVDTWRHMLGILLTPPWRGMFPSYDEEGKVHYYSKFLQLTEWTWGWVLTLAGIIGTGIFAPYFVIAWHIPPAYQNYVEIGLAFLGGLVWQAVGLLLASLSTIILLTAIKDYLLNRSTDLTPVTSDLLKQAEAAAEAIGKQPEAGFDELSHTQAETADDERAFLQATFNKALVKAFALSALGLSIGLLIGILLPLGTTGLLLYWYFSHFAPHHDLVGTGILGATLLKLAITFGIPLIKGLVTGQIFAWILRWIRNERPPRPKGKPLPSQPA